MAQILIRGSNPIWYLPDLVGEPLNDEYYAFFLTNVFPYVPQAVYSDVEGVNAWSNPLQFQPGGTLPNNLYFDATEVYRIEIRHGNTQADALIYEINNYAPGAAQDVINNQIESVDNQITNPQFAEIFFAGTEADPYVYTETVSGTYSIELAPGWFLDLEGAGTSEISQIELAGNSDIEGSPPYALHLVNSGWTQVYLRQRFERNGAIFASGSVSMSATIRPYTLPASISLLYSPSVASIASTIQSTTLDAGEFSVIAGTINLPDSINTDVGDAAYVDMIIVLPDTSTIDITNVQVLGHTTPIVDPDSYTTPLFRQETIERTIDHTFHTYSDQLITRGKNSILTGWDFPLNPWQFDDGIVGIPSGFETATQTLYALDQTIIHQETVSSLTIARSNDERFLGSLVITGYNGVAPTANRFALIQYIDPQNFEGNWGTYLSCLIKAFSAVDVPSPVRLKVRLIYRSTLPPTIGANEPITGWDANGDVEFAAGWTSLSPQNDPAYFLSFSPESEDGTSGFPSYSFNKFEVPAAPTDDGASTLGIVVYIMDPLETAVSPSTSGSIVFNNISLVPNLFAVEANRLTFDETLSQCQYYYQRSFDPGVATENAAGLSNGESYLIQTHATLTLCAIDFANLMRATPTIAFYNPVNNNSEAYNVSTTSDSGAVAVQLQNLRTFCVNIATNGGSAIGDLLVLNWTADSRLGV